MTAYDPLLNEPLHRRAVFVMSARRPAMSRSGNRRPRPRCTTCGAPLHHGDCLDCGPRRSRRHEVRQLCGADHR